MHSYHSGKAKWRGVKAGVSLTEWIKEKTGLQKTDFLHFRASGTPSEKLRYSKKLYFFVVFFVILFKFT